MAIGSSALNTGNFEHVLLNRNQRGKRRGKVLQATLMLTSMVDMFSMLVCFMLQTFSSTPEILVAKGVTLPDSITGKTVKEAPVLSLNKDELFLDQKLIGKTAVVLKKPDQLVSKLIDLRKSWVKAHPGEAFGGDINVQADKDVSSVVISQLMGIVSGQHYSAIQLAVLGGVQAE
jgi:biopolymer transport protein ExbD